MRFPPPFNPSSILRVVKRSGATVPGYSTKLYLVTIEGKHLVDWTQEGIDSAGVSDEGGYGNVDGRDADLSTQRNVWVPLSVMQQVLPSFVNNEDLPAKVNKSFSLHTLINIYDSHSHHDHLP